MSCPDHSTLLQFASELSPPAERATVLAHLDRCALCRATIAAILASSSAEIEPALAIPTDTDEPSSLPQGPELQGTDELAQGSQVDRYEILSTLGSGGMGVVYLARDPQLERNLALKVIQPTLLRSGRGPALLARLLKEAQALASLSHDNVLTIYDVGSFASGLYLAIEHVEGTTLSQWLVQHQPSAEEVLRVLLRVGRGLEAAHKKGLVHRDVKPDNILLSNDGRVRVTDFGLATFEPLKATDGSDPSEIDPSQVLAQRFTQTGVLLGTPAYMSPEQLEGQHADATSDQFSFCITLFEALMGHRPFQGKTTGKLLTAIHTGMRSPSALHRLPSQIIQPILRGLSTDPEDRFPSMTALLSALELGLRHLQSPKWQPLRYLRYAALLLLLLAGGIWWWSTRTTTTTSNPPASSPSGQAQARSSLTDASTPVSSPQPPADKPLAKPMDKPLAKQEAKPSLPMHKAHHPRVIKRSYTKVAGMHHKQRPSPQPPLTLHQAAMSPANPSSLGQLRVRCPTPINTKVGTNGTINRRLTNRLFLLPAGTHAVFMFDPNNERWRRFSTKVKAQRVTVFTCPASIRPLSCPPEICPR